MNDLPTNIMDTWLVRNDHRIRVNLGESNVSNLHLDALFPGARDCLQLPEPFLGNNSTWGSQSLRDAIADTYPGVPSQQVLVTAGVSEAVVTLGLAHLQRGVNLVIPVPAFHALMDVPARLGYEIRTLPLSERTGMRLRVADVVSRVDSNTRIVLLNSPHNPTGVVYPPEDILEIADAVRAVNAVVVVDEHYRYLTHDDSEQLRSVSLLRDNIVTLGSVGKCFGCTGIRVGWMVASEALLARYHHYKLLVTHTIPLLSDHLAATVLRRRRSLLAATRMDILTNLERLRSLAGRLPRDLLLLEPDAGGVAFVKLMRIEASFAFAQRLLERSGVLVLPGESFEMPGFLRLRLGIAPGQFALALAALEESLADSPSRSEIRGADHVEQSV